MLKELRLTNIILVESTSIPFTEGFNVLSGESGSGKSAILNALNLIAGERSDTSVIRRGADKGIVEAVFDITSLPLLKHLLDEAGIDHEDDNDLFVRREISATGKSRAFINNQLAQLNLLKQVGEHLLDIVGQHANQKLLSLDYQKKIVDLFGDLTDDLTIFTHLWEEENEVRETLEKLQQSESQRLREIEICRIEIEELQEASLKEGEEEELFSQYTALTSAEELLQKVGDITRVLSGEKIAVLNHLGKQKTTFDQLIKIAPVLAEAAVCYENARLELEEVAHTLRVYESRIEHNPEKADKINTRLELINRLKKKYGGNIQEIQTYLTNTEKKLQSLENADADIELLTTQLKVASEKTNKAAANLSAKRATTAKKLETAVISHLHSLNMGKAAFYVEITPQKRGSSGDDRIEFYLMPNIGEHRLPLKECASGGELSRMLLSIQALLAGKEKIPTLIFDEIDANIGGETAAVVGEKLRHIAEQHQILCITHFPQVAKQAQHHLKIYKKEIDGRTVTLIDMLDNIGQKQELQRMKAEK
ncbi:MAG: DNA repair protein RecN [Parachlamydiaceae bacterium]